MRRWLKLLGTPEAPMDEEHVSVVLRRIRFPNPRPTMRPGDKVVLYALGHDRVFGIVTVFSAPVQVEGENPWDRWECRVRPSLVVAYPDAPNLDEVSVGSRQLRKSIRQQSHIALGEDEYAGVVDALRAAGGEPDALYRP